MPGQAQPGVEQPLLVQVELQLAAGVLQPGLAALVLAQFYFILRELTSHTDFGREAASIFHIFLGRNET